MKTAEEKRAYRRALYQSRKLASVCIECAAGLQDSDGLSCVDCTARSRVSQIRYRARHRASKNRKDRKRHNRVRAERRDQGLCGRCIRRAVEGRTLCESHLEHMRVLGTAARARKKAGIVSIKRQPMKAPSKYIEENSYTPRDELEQQPRVRLIKALAHFDWVNTRELFDVLNIPDYEEGGQNLERDAFAQRLTWLVKNGFAQQRGTHGKRDYQLTDQGRDEYKRIRSGDLVTKARRVA